MARLYSNENFTLLVVVVLRQLGHDVLTSYDSGKANQSIPDADVLAFAAEQERALLTFNRKDFFKLHAANPNHAGIIACTFDGNSEALAGRIDAELGKTPELANQLIRINKPQS